MLSALLGHAVGIALILLGAAALRAWIRHRDREHALVAAPLGVLGVIGVLRQVTPLSGDHLGVLTVDLRLVTFLACAYALLRFRDCLVPLSPGFRSFMGIAVAGVATVSVLGGFAEASGAQQFSPLHLVAVAVILALTGICVGEPAVRFWLASSGRPRVQRARLRALAGGYAGISVLPIAVFASARGGLLGLIAPCLALAVAPLLGAVFFPPAWLRRHWRRREEDAFGQATTELLGLSRDRAALAERSLEWATRLVGAETGVIRLAEGELLAVRGLDAAGAAAMLAQASEPGPSAVHSRRDSRRDLVVIPLAFEAGTGLLVIGAGPFTPLLGSDEVARLEQYAASMTAALDRVQLTEILAAQTARYQSLLQAISDLGEGVVITDAGRPVYMNDAYVALTGYTREELEEMPSLLELAPPEARDELGTRLASRLAGEEVSHHYDSQIVTRGGRRIDVENAVRLLTGDDGLPIVAIVRDVTERRRIESALAERMEDLAQIAASDPLTGLANRREFERVLAEPRTARFAVLAIDVDNLKVVNDVYGHEAGDDQLRAVAEALRGGMRTGDCLARTGGDEFSALLPDTGLAEAAAAAERIRRTMHGVVVPHGTARVTIGCAVGEADADALDVWGASDDALYRAKEGGRDRVECAGATTGAAAPSLARWGPLLGSLLDERRLRAVFQPIVDLERAEVVAFEALARPSDGPLDTSVESLFAAAERLGVGRDLDWLCRRVALQEAKELPGGLPLFLNVGASSLLDPVHDVDQMLLLLRWAGRSPAECVLEISEREAVRDLRRLREVLCTYREHGFRFALDDVGEGHSTFEVLATAVPEYVKISARLTHHAGERGAGAVIHALVTFAEQTGTQLVAEGIETAEHLAAVRRIGVPLGQGFWLGRPAAIPTLQTTFTSAAVQLR